MSTDISSLLQNTDEEDKIQEVDLSSKDEDDLCDIFFDGDMDIEVRVKALEYLWTKNQELCTECVNKISSMFMFTPTSIFRSLLKYIVINSSIDANIQNECARAIYDENKDSGYECFICLSDKLSSFPTPLQLDIVRTLMETDKYYEKTSRLLNTITTNQKLECEYRYKSLLTIQRDSSRSFIPKYLDDAFLEFVRDNKTYTRYRIIGSQYLIQHKSISQEVKDEIESICISFARDNTLDYNLRADAADLLVRAGSASAKEVGREIITLLGRSPDGFTTVYTDRQNVHDEKIEENISKFILELSSIRLKVNSEGNYVSFSDVQKEIELITKLELEAPVSRFSCDTSSSPNFLDKVRSSFLRISIDQTIYDGGQTLQSIFNKVWQIINEHEYCELLKERMVEELIDMADTCASGHVSRVINVLSGFEVDGKTVGINIGWKKQVQSNLIARLQARIKLIEDEDKQFQILDEMITSGDITNKPTLNIFFRDNLLSIRQEMFNEFVGDGYINEDEFEEHFRNAITFFEEGGN